MRNLLLLAIVVLTGSATVAAQEDSRLVAAVRLAQDGKGDSARAIVLDLISSTPQGDTLFPQIVYTMGLVARDAGDRSRNFRRVAVEFAASAWADDALLGLAQEDFAAGRAEASARSIERIRADYPTSSLLPVAAFWGVRAYFELGKREDACRWLGQGLALAGEDVELQNQLNFYAPRCGPGSTEPASAQGPPPVRPDTTAATPPAPPPATPATNPPATPAGTGKFTVQVAAASTEAAAQSTSTALRNAGYDPHIVREGGFIKVRVGRFGTRAEAVAAASQVRAKMGGSPFVVEEQ
jgi:cell division septation protein DedD